MSLSIVGVSGSISHPSRTTSLVETLLAESARRFGNLGELVNIATLIPELGASANPSNLPPSVQAAQQKLLDADLLIVASPIYKASYSGLLKHFFDLVAPQALHGKVAILAATGGSDLHALAALEHQLRPLLNFFVVHTVPTTLFVHEKNFSKDANGHYILTETPLLRERIEQLFVETERLLGATIPSTPATSAT